MAAGATAGAGASGGPTPSPWVLRWAHLFRPGARVLDVACGSGRHLRALDGRGLHLFGVDRDADALLGLAPRASVTVADLEGGPWPFPGQRFDGLVVTNYLWRPLLPVLAACLAPGGVAMIETFARGHEAIGRPSNPDFLLRPGELLDWAAESGLRVVAYEDGFEAAPPRMVQRIVAAREPGPTGGSPAPAAAGPRRPDGAWPLGA